MNTPTMRLLKSPCLVLVIALFLSGCSSLDLKKPQLPSLNSSEQEPWENNSEVHKDLTNLPKTKGRIFVSVFGFQDRTGQYKAAPSNSFSTAVTQGASAFLVSALNDSGWFLPLEREGLQNILTERKIIRSRENKDLPALASAGIVIDGSIIAYDSNVVTGGAGAKYFGAGASTTFRKDQLTINVRAIDVYSGQIINSVTITKSILSKELSSGIFRFVKFKRLLEMEAGYSHNDPIQLVLRDAIEMAVIRLITTGINKKNWNLADPTDIDNPLVKRYGAL